MDANKSIRTEIYAKEMSSATDQAKRDKLTEDLYLSIAKVAKEARIQSGIKSIKIAEVLGTTPSHIGLWESGKTKMPLHAYAVYESLCKAPPLSQKIYKEISNISSYSSKAVNDIPRNSADTREHINNIVTQIDSVLTPLFPYMDTELVEHIEATKMIFKNIDAALDFKVPSIDFTESE